MSIEVSGKLVESATKWTDNGDLIADLARLGYLHTEDLTLDPTFGGGVWWKKWCPHHLVKHDLYKLDGVDFRRLPEDDDTFDAIAYDPPYVSQGGRKTSTIKEFYDRFGLEGAPRTPAELQEMINDGLTEMSRVLKPRKRGSRPPVLLVKCQDYVSGGKLWLGTHHTLTHALSLGLECWDRIEHIGDPRAQPKNRTRKDGKPVVQQHTRRNLSTMFVLRAPR